MGNSDVLYLIFNIGVHGSYQKTSAVTDAADVSSSQGQ
jgi:hypothetical protein